MLCFWWNHMLIILYIIIHVDLSLWFVYSTCMLDILLLVMLNKNPIYLHNWVFWQHIIFINSYFLTHTQIVAAFMMMQNLNKRGFRAFSFTIPSSSELLQIFEIAAPVFVTTTSKVCFFFCSNIPCPLLNFTIPNYLKPFR